MQPARRRVRTAALCCSAALLVALAAAAPLRPPLQKLLAESNITLWQEVLRISGVLDDVQAPPARWAAFVPTDAAVRSFLQQMGLTMQGLEARPGLARALVSNHLVLGLTPEAQQRLLAGELTTVAPVAAGAAGGTNTTLLRVVVNAPGTPQQRLSVTDAQGQTALRVKTLNVGDANKIGVVIDKVLLSDHIYTSFESLCKQRAQQAGLSCDLLARSGLLANGLGSPTWPNTLFVPGNKAIAAAGLAADGSVTSKAELRRVVEHHALPGLHAIPDGLTNGTSYQTMLAGTFLKAEYDKGLPVTTKAGALLEGGNATVAAFIVPADGQRVPVVVHDIYVGQAIAHGIPAVLLPPGWQRRKAAAGGPSGGVAAAATSGRRRLAAFPEQTKVTQTLNSAETSIRDKVRSAFRDDEARWA